MTRTTLSLTLLATLTLACDPKDDEKAPESTTPDPTPAKITRPGSPPNSEALSWAKRTAQARPGCLNASPSCKSRASFPGPSRPARRR